MEIEYLKSYIKNKETLDNYPTILSNPEGKTIEEIVELEELYNSSKPFPKAFREYLFIGGQFNSIGFNDGIDGNFKGLMNYYKKRLKERGMEITRPYIIFHNFEGEGLTFIYLDEGDDPQPWNASVDEAYDTDEGEQIWKVPHPNFSDLINTLVQRALDGVQPW